MRSRYAAYVLGQVDHILDTLHPDHREDVDRTATETWSKEATWNGLRILATDGGGEAEEKGTVEFKADFELRGMRQVHHERARFERKDGRWYYVDGDLIAPEPITRVGPRTGRNDPCPCGSGKKYKKCHGKAA